MNRGRLAERLVILAVAVIYIGYMIPPRNVAVFVLGGFHSCAGLLFGEAVKGQAGIVGKFGDNTPRREKLGFVHKKDLLFTHFVKHSSISGTKNRKFVDESITQKAPAGNRERRFSEPVAAER